MTPSVEQWSLYDASQNLAAVLNDPNKGKQTNFFVKTWGDTFVEHVGISKNPALPEVTHANFENYLGKFRKRYHRHRMLEKIPSEQEHIRQQNADSVDVSTIPEIFLQKQFHLNKPEVFKVVFPIEKSPNELLEELSHYLDTVEVQIAKYVSQKSNAFFHAMTSHDTIMEQMKITCNEVSSLRNKLQAIDKKFINEPLRLIGLQRSKMNNQLLENKLKLMNVVLQTQPTLQLLLSSCDYVGALELIGSTQEVLAKELSGVTCLRHLPSQLKGMLKFIDQLLTSEFKRFVIADLHSLDDETLLRSEQLIGLVSGLLRRNNYQFLDIYKQECVTAVQALLKQHMIEAIVDMEDDNEHCLTGSGEHTPSMNASYWIRAVMQANEALKRLLGKVCSVHSIIKKTSDASLITTTNEESKEEVNKFLTSEIHKQLETKLKDLLFSVSEYCNERLATLIRTQSEKQILTSSQILQLSDVVDSFCTYCESCLGCQHFSLRSAFKIQANNYIFNFHAQRKNKLTILLDAERWKPAEVASEFQMLIDNLASDSIITSLPNVVNGKKSSGAITINSQQYVTIGTVLILIRLVCEYCVCAYELKLLALTIGRNLSDLLKTFNSRSCQLVLGAGALKTAGLKTITSTNLALTSRSLQLVLWVIPKIKNQFKALTNDDLHVFDNVEMDIRDHIQQLEAKVIVIINTLLGDQLNDWDAKPPVPSNVFRNISKQLNKLHEAVAGVLSKQQVVQIYESVHAHFKTSLRVALAKMNIQNNGSPQHGVVIGEIVFYIQTMQKLDVLPKDSLYDNNMDEIWHR